MALVGIVTPVFNDRAAFLKLLDRLANEAQTSPHSLHVVVVDDGSLIDPVNPEDLTGRTVSIDLVKLNRNVGHQRAILVGLCHMLSRGGTATIVVMDGDGEDRPADVPRLLEAFDEAGNVDAVVALRAKRHDGALYRTFYFLYRLLFWLLTGRAIRFGNFCAISPALAHRLVHMDEAWLHLAGSILKSGARISFLPLDRGERFYGSSKMGFVSLTLHGLRSVSVFLEDVLMRLIFFCVALAILSALGIVVALALKLAGVATPGWMTAAVGTLLGVLLQTGTIALLALLLTIGGSRGFTAVTPYEAAQALQWPASGGQHEIIARPWVGSDTAPGGRAAASPSSRPQRRLRYLLGLKIGRPGQIPIDDRGWLKRSVRLDRLVNVNSYRSGAFHHIRDGGD